MEKFMGDTLLCGVLLKCLTVFERLVLAQRAVSLIFKVAWGDAHISGWAEDKTVILRITIAANALKQQ